LAGGSGWGLGCDPALHAISSGGIIRWDTSPSAEARMPSGTAKRSFSSTAVAASPTHQVRQIVQQMRLAVDRVMAEGSLYDPTLAALAIKQTEGDLVEAAFLVRAYRSTLPRLQTTPLLRTSGCVSSGGSPPLSRMSLADKFSVPPETTHNGSSTFPSWMSAALPRAAAHRLARRCTRGDRADFGIPEAGGTTP